MYGMDSNVFLMLKSLLYTFCGKVLIVFVVSFHMFACVVKIATNYYVILVIAFSSCCLKKKHFVCNFCHLSFVMN